MGRGVKRTRGQGERESGGLRRAWSPRLPVSLSPCRLLIAGLLCAASLHATTYYLTIAGLGGEPDYEQRFAMWATEIESILKAAGPDATIEKIGRASCRERV